MEKPSTLLELTNAHPSVDLDQSILVLVDYQYEYLQGELALPGALGVIDQSQKLLALARGRHIPVIHVKQLGGKTGIFSARRGEIIAEVAPIFGEPVIEKSLPNAFAGTRLADVLKNHPGRHQLIIAGFMTHMCITFTASAAAELGYFSTIIASTTATRSLRGAAEEVIDAETVKASSLAALKDRFAIVVNSLADLPH